MAVPGLTSFNFSDQLQVNGHPPIFQGTFFKVLLDCSIYFSSQISVFVIQNHISWANKCISACLSMTLDQAYLFHTVTSRFMSQNFSELDFRVQFLGWKWQPSYLTNWILSSRNSKHMPTNNFVILNWVGINS